MMDIEWFLELNAVIISISVILIFRSKSKTLKYSLVLVMLLSTTGVMLHVIKKHNQKRQYAKLYVGHFLLDDKKSEFSSPDTCTHLALHLNSDYTFILSKTCDMLPSLQGHWSVSDDLELKFSNGTTQVVKMNYEHDLVLENLGYMFYFKRVY